MTRAQDGTGLGLPLVKSFIELHGGTLHLRSALGEGTKVTLSFPVDRTRARPLASAKLLDELFTVGETPKLALAA